MEWMRPCLVDHLNHAEAVDDKERTGLVTLAITYPSQLLLLALGIKSRGLPGDGFKMDSMAKEIS